MSGIKRAAIGGRVKFLGDETGAREVEAVVTDGTLDRMNDILVPEGARFRSYLQGSASVLWQHDANFPVAKCISMNLVNGQIIARARFPSPGVSAKADECYGLIREGVVNATSVGFRPLVWDYMDEYSGVIYREFEIIEFSYVSIPANPSALITQRSVGASAGIADRVRRAAEIRERFFGRRATNDQAARLAHWQALGAEIKVDLQRERAADTARRVLVARAALRIGR